jgi:hypothetical protein
MRILGGSVNEKKNVDQIYTGLFIIILSIFGKLLYPSLSFLCNLFIFVGVITVIYVGIKLRVEDADYKNKKNCKPIKLGKNMSLVTYLYVYLSHENGQWKTMGKVAGRKKGVYLLGKDAIEWSDYDKSKENAIKMADFLKIPFKENK